jgi:hypothetical protein
MLPTNSNIYLILVKRNKKVKNNKIFTYDILIAYKRGHSSFFVIEKLGSLDYYNKKIVINKFRLVY